MSTTLSRICALHGCSEVMAFFWCEHAIKQNESLRAERDIKMTDADLHDIRTPDGRT